MKIRSIMSKTSLGVITLLMILAAPQIGYTQIFCVGDKEYGSPDFLLGPSTEASYHVSFDVIGFQPRNFRISGLNTISVNTVAVIRDPIEKTLNGFTWLADTIGFELTMRYVVLDRRSVNRSFLEVISSNEIRIVGRRRPMTVDVCPGETPPDSTIDSVYVNGRVAYRDGKAPVSDIVVERNFEEGKDSTVIVKSNYPNLSDDILADAQRFSKRYFTDRAPKATHFFIRYRVSRDLPDCGLTLVY
jgi:hypothetical protein